MQSSSRMGRALLRVLVELTTVRGRFSECDSVATDIGIKWNCGELNIDIRDICLNGDGTIEQLHHDIVVSRSDS